LKTPLHSADSKSVLAQLTNKIVSFTWLIASYMIVRNLASNKSLADFED